MDDSSIIADMSKTISAYVYNGAAPITDGGSGIWLQAGVWNVQLVHRNRYMCAHMY